MVGFGAADCVAPPCVLPQLPRCSSMGSALGQTWLTANQAGEVRREKADCDHERLARAQRELPNGWCHTSIEFHFKNLRQSQHRCFPLKWMLGGECMDRTKHALEQGRNIRTMSGLLREPMPLFWGSERDAEVSCKYAGILYREEGNVED